MHTSINTLGYKSSLKILQSPGVEFIFDGQPAYFRSTVTVFSADNLAAWNIGGFKALASAFRRCHYCMVTNEELQTQVINVFQFLMHECMLL